ncbi:MAG: UDP-glucose dehydrogenase family protein [Vulcanimicrobiaceae bacterium]
MARPKICIVGTGYVGMASAIGLAELGCDVKGYDIIPERVLGLRAGITPYREAGIEDMLRRNLEAGRLDFVADHDEAVHDAEIVIICVGTPSTSDGSADLRALNASIRALRNGPLAPDAVVVIRSTVPPGTSDLLAATLAGRAEVIYAPEFLREGSAVVDFLGPDRTVVGASSVQAAARYARLFEALQAPVVVTTRRNAELIKLGSNAFLAMKISFANEIANMCDAVDAEADDVLRAIGYDRRIGSMFLMPGIGFGGPCFEKDLKNYQRAAARLGVRSELVSATLRVNELQPRRVVDLLEEELGSLAGARIGVWGVTFKAGTDDTRDSLAIRCLEDLSERGASVRVFDPVVAMAPLPERCSFAPSALEAAECDALAVLTEWPVFRDVAPALLAACVRSGLVVDGRNHLDAERLVAAGMRYRGVGRSSGAGLQRRLTSTLPPSLDSQRRAS